MPNQSLIAALNRALAIEYAASIQYLQHSFLVSGPQREVFRNFFRIQSDESHSHAAMLGDKVIALGGSPTTEPAAIRQAVVLAEMLEHDLALERDGLAAYTDAWEACLDTERPVRFLLEERIAAEQLHIDHLEQLTAVTPAENVRSREAAR